MTPKTLTRTVQMRWFLRALAASALFHLAATPRGAALESWPLALLSVVLTALAAAALLGPVRWLPRVGLGLGVVTVLHVWAELPVVGNHWVLAGLLGLSLALGAAAGGLTRALGPLRVTLWAAYAFAAFAKLNADFLDPATSCVVAFQERSVQSWGLGGLSAAPYPALGTALALMTVVVELTVAALLAVPRTRRAGLVLALWFHWALALDLAQHFWDFSSVLFAGWLLFLDREQVTYLRGLRRTLRRRLPRFSAPEAALLRFFAGVGAALVAALNVAPTHLGLWPLLAWAGHLSWWVYGTLVAALLTLSSLRAPAAPGRSLTAAPAAPAWVWAAAGLCVLNGLTPYLELKTGFGWNMYSNLRVAGGVSNHLLLPRTPDMTGVQRRSELVYIVSSPDPELQRLTDENYALVFSEFREYAARFPDSAATYRYHGEVRRAARLGDDPLLRGPVSVVDAKLLSFRVVDLAEHERCQPSFSPAR